jgi:hypothetical protein
MHILWGFGFAALYLFFELRDVSALLYYIGMYLMFSRCGRD